MKTLCPSDASWLSQPEKSVVSNDHVEIVTQPYSDFWQKTQHSFQHDNGHALVWEIEEKFFTLSAKAQWNSEKLYDHCGIVVYQDSGNWAKVGAEYNNAQTAWMGSVVTHHGYSDWAIADISAEITSAWYRLSRRESDFLFEYSLDGVAYHQMRIFHLFQSDEKVRCGLYACSPLDASFTAVFTQMAVGECCWEG